MSSLGWAISREMDVGMAGVVVEDKYDKYPRWVGFRLPESVCGLDGPFVVLVE